MPMIAAMLLDSKASRGCDHLKDHDSQEVEIGPEVDVSPDDLFGRNTGRLDVVYDSSRISQKLA